METSLALVFGLGLLIAAFAFHRFAKKAMREQGTATGVRRVGWFSDLHLLCMGAAGFMGYQAVTTRGWVGAIFGAAVGFFVVLMSGGWFWIPGVSGDSNAPKSADASGSTSGGLGEHYCSRKCYAAGGATITKHLLERWTGDCSVCREPVSLQVGGRAGMVCWKPGVFLFHCGSPSCVDAVRTQVRQSGGCAVCGKSV